MLKFEREFKQSDNLDERSYWFFVKDQSVLFGGGADNCYLIPLIKAPKEVHLEVVHTHYLGRYNGICCFVANVGKGETSPPGLRFYPIRTIFHHLAPDLLEVILYALQIINWDQGSQFCGRCGNKMAAMETERAKRCVKCSAITYPRLSPAVIVAIVKNDKILLARSRRYRDPQMFSVLAGFVEAGENLEECVKREIREEVALEVTNIRYFGSQSWPFPDSFMIGFTAEYSSGEISVDNDEITEAKWFSASELPKIPTTVSISGQLIDWFIKR